VRVLRILLCRIAWGIGLARLVAQQKLGTARGGDDLAMPAGRAEAEALFARGAIGHVHTLPAANCFSKNTAQHLLFLEKTQLT